jgi:diguanylate cyclase (GGDEF)-like protein
MDDDSFILESPLFSLVEHSFEGVALARPNPWRIVYANTVLANWLGCTSSELQARRLEELVGTSPSSQLLETVAAVWQGASGGATISGRLLVGRKGPRPVDLRFVRIAMPGETLLGILVHQSARPQIVSGAASEERRDPLTGLHDRSFLLARLEALLQSERSADHNFAILFVDLDNFKQINDAYGHLVGDGVLAEVACRLSQCVREGDYVVRFGGDEFVVLMERLSHGLDVQSVVDRIHFSLEEPIAIAQGEARLSVSVGVAEASPEFRSPEDLLAAADRAMYASKRLRS